ncbi:MAG: hypothetical protein A2142_01950 [candidate division Zixibacteria bacterium RBG_16_48_11]|nr:MAG: hypothetical protein A2142_01950 [candidate division Zixibacteria bacterium RBG_16_48_11]
MLPRARLKQILSYQEKKGRKKGNCFLVEGTRLVEEALRSDWRVQELYFSSEFSESQTGKNLLSLACQRKVETVQIQAQALRKMAETETPQGAIAVVEKKELGLNNFLRQNPDFIVVLESVRDPGNLGTIIRTADALGVKAVLISKDSVELYNPKTVRSTMGSIFHLPIFYPVDILDTLRVLKRDFRMLAAVAGGGVSAHKIDYSNPVCLLLGGEAFGLSEEIVKLADLKVSIPSFGQAESLNLSVAAGILMYEIAKSKNLRTKSEVLRNKQE